MRYCLAILIIFTLSACGTAKWYHPTKGAGDFVKEKAECEAIAEYHGLNASLTGRRIEPNAYYGALYRCLAQKGWSLTPPLNESVEKSPAVKLMTKRLDDTTFMFEGKTVVLPPGSKLTKHTLTTYGLLFMETLEFEGKINELPYDGQIVFQKALGASKFKPIIYPLTQPFFTYSQGQLPNGLRWHSFAGKLDKEWYGGIGCYWRLSKKKRMVTTLTALLPVQDTPPPPRCFLNDAQAKTLDEFLSAVLPWFETLEIKKKVLPALTRERFRFTFSE
ncbi:MAG: hypothetical protein JRI34_08765 [Deltaproteobacteria bacterium]|nr:hypothetical protein [Deltaproteobacteria bacterium]